MEFTEDDITRLAEMGRLELSSSEKALYLKDIQAIVSYVSEISKLSLPDNKQGDDTINVLREDVVIPYAGDTRTLIEQAPSHEDGYVSVPSLFNPYGRQVLETVGRGGGRSSITSLRGW